MACATSSAMEQSFEAPDINKRPACSSCRQTTCADQGCWGVPKMPPPKSSILPATGAKTSQFYEVAKDLPARFNNPEWFGGYGSKKEHALYRTTNAEYGKLPPTVHTMPLMFRPMTEQFTEPLGKCGMYRDNGLTTSTNKTAVPDH